MRLIKYLASIIVFLALLTTFGAYLAIQIIGVDDIKQFITEQVADATGRRINLDGEITPTISFKPTVTITKVRFGNPDWASNADLLQAEEIDLSFNVLPLIQGTIEINHVTLRKAVLHLESSSKGKSWEIKSPKAKEALKESTPEASDTDAPASDGADSSFFVSKVELFDSTIHYHEAGKTETLNVSKLLVTDITEHSVGQLALDGKYKALNFAINGESMGETIELDTQAHGEGVNLGMKGNLAFSDMTYDMHVQLEVASLQQLGKSIGMPLSGSESIKLDTALSGQLELIRMRDMVLDYSTTQISGSAELNLAGRKPYLKAKLSVPQYAVVSKPAAPAKQEGATDSATKAPAKEASLPFHFLNQANADIDLNVGKLSTDSMQLHDVKTTLLVKDSALTVAPFNASMSKGFLSGKATINAKEKTPVISIDVTTKDLAIEPFLNRSKITNVKEGVLQGHIILNASGTSERAIKQTLNGKIDLYADRARFEVPPKVKNAAKFFRLLGEKDIVDVSCLVGQFEVKDGIARTQTLALKTPIAVVSGSGSVNLPAESLSMAMKVNQSSIGLSDIVPPLRITGPYANLSVSPDTAGSLIGIGKLVLGASSGVGLAAVLGEQVTDKLGITGSGNPCLQSIVDAQKEPEKNRSAKETYKQMEDVVREKRDEIKEKAITIKDDAKATRDELKDKAKTIENDVKAIRDNLKGLLKKKDPAPAPAPAPAP
ncbi:MAG: AsmA family protein [Rickettsiales bacterium]|nr:AsmA family protein [Rickettsiales bacterium]